MPIDIRAARPEAWPALEALFGPSGACYNCWCTHFLLAPKLRQEMPGADRRAILRNSLDDQLPPGLLAFDGDVAVGWVRVGPRADVPRWNGDRTVSKPLDGEDWHDRSHWAISCYFVASKRRGEGLSHALTEAAISFAREHGARVLDVCPMRQAKQSKSIGLFVGSVSVIEKHGFETVAERKDGRPLMRRVLT